MTGRGTEEAGGFTCRPVQQRPQQLYLSLQLRQAEMHGLVVQHGLPEYLPLCRVLHGLPDYIVHRGQNLEQEQVNEEKK